MGCQFCTGWLTSLQMIRGWQWGHSILTQSLNLSWSSSQKPTIFMSWNLCWALSKCYSKTYPPLDNFSSSSLNSSGSSFPKFYRLPWRRSCRDNSELRTCIGIISNLTYWICTERNLWRFSRSKRWWKYKKLIRKGLTIVSDSLTA